MGFFGRLIVHNGGKALGVIVEENENKENVVQVCVLWRNKRTGTSNVKEKVTSDRISNGGGVQRPHRAASFMLVPFRLNGSRGGRQAS